MDFVDLNKPYCKPHDLTMCVYIDPLYFYHSCELCMDTAFHGQKTLLIANIFNEKYNTINIYNVIFYNILADVYIRFLY